MIKIEVSNNIDLYNLNENQKTSLIELCTGTNPAYKLLEQMARTKPKLKYALRKTPTTLCLAIQHKSHLSVPRGLHSVIKQKFSEASFSYNTVDPVIDIPFNATFSPRIDQDIAITQLLKEDVGVFEAPTGSGKTVCALEVAKRLGLKTLFIVHTGRLLAQTLEEAEKKLGTTPGVIGNGKFDVKDFTVAMVQTLGRRDLKNISRYFGLIIIDEAHRVPANTFMQVIRQFHAKHIYGFTATPHRDDGLSWALEQIVGPITAKIDKKQLQAQGTILKPKVVFIDTPYKPSKCYDAFDLANHISELVEDPARNKFILNHIHKHIDPNKRAIILTARVDHAEYLAQKLSKYNPLLYHGQLTGKEKELVGRGMKVSNQFLTIATYQSISEGFDVPNWEILWLAAPFSSSILTTQALGRISRSSAGKLQALVYDFVDVNDEVLARRAEKRKQTYATL